MRVCACDHGDNTKWRLITAALIKAADSDRLACACQGVVGNALLRFVYVSEALSSQLGVHAQ